MEANVVKENYEKLTPSFSIWSTPSVFLWWTHSIWITFISIKLFHSILTHTFLPSFCKAYIWRQTHLFPYHQMFIFSSPSASSSWPWLLGSMTWFTLLVLLYMHKIVGRMADLLWSFSITTRRRTSKSLSCSSPSAFSSYLWLFGGQWPELQCLWLYVCTRLMEGWLIVLFLFGEYVIVMLYIVMFPVPVVFNGFSFKISFIEVIDLHDTALHFTCART